MGSFGGYYKGEKKKKKKATIKNTPNAFGAAPTIAMPEIISKKPKGF